MIILLDNALQIHEISVPANYDEIKQAGFEKQIACSWSHEYGFSKFEKFAQQGDAPEPATNVLPASPKSISPAR